MSDKKKKEYKNKIGIRGFGLVCGVVSCILGINTAANATTMCMTSDSTSIILDPSVDGTGEPTYNAANATWSVTFANNANGGTVSGISTCNNTSGTRAVPQPQYNDVFSTGTTGTLCWCRMTSPVRSTWVLFYTFDSASVCATDCVGYCATLTRNYASFRTAFFTGAGN